MGLRHHQPGPADIMRITPEAYNLNEVMIDNSGQEEQEEDQTRSPCLQSLYRLHLRVFRPKKVELNTTEKVLELLQPVRYKPTSVAEMAEETKFTRSEVKFLYRAFKQECPNGIIDEDTFKDVYENIFPLGDASKYASLVFKCIDKDETGGITFGDFMEFLSVISKGTTQEKIMWSFEFLDLDKNGYIEKQEMLKVLEAVYEMVLPGNNICHSDIVQQADCQFQKMDLDRDGLVSRQEFLQYCSTDDTVIQSMCVLP